jgi:alkylation response protein AidB-like acyl-CoA dehydrogenase
MNFDLTDEQYQMRDQVRRVLEGSYDANALAKGATAAAEVARRLAPDLNNLGLPLILTPEAQGGMGMGLVTLCALAEEFGRQAAPTSVLNNALGAWTVATFGDQEQRAKWLEPLLAGEAQAAFAFSEGVGCGEPETWQVSRSDAVGRKLWVERGSDAALLIVGLRDGVGLLDASGASFEPDPREPMDVTRPVVDVTFNPSDCSLIGDAAASAKLFDALLVLAAADAAGAGGRALEMTVDYAKIRSQFGRLIGTFQGLKHQLANMAVDIEPARFLCWFAAHCWDSDPANASRAAALAKAHAGDVGVKTARASVEAHGGIGYTWEYPLHIFLKRAMHDRISLASSAALRERVARIDGISPALVQAAG